MKAQDIIDHIYKYVRRLGIIYDYIDKSFKEYGELIRTVHGSLDMAKISARQSRLLANLPSSAAPSTKGHDIASIMIMIHDLAEYGHFIHDLAQKIINDETVIHIINTSKSTIFTEKLDLERQNINKVWHICARFLVIGDYPRHAIFGAKDYINSLKKGQPPKKGASTFSADFKIKEATIYDVAIYCVELFGQKKVYSMVKAMLFGGDSSQIIIYLYKALYNNLQPAEEIMGYKLNDIIKANLLLGSTNIQGNVRESLEGILGKRSGSLAMPEKAELIKYIQGLVDVLKMADEHTIENLWLTRYRLLPYGRFSSFVQLAEFYPAFRGKKAIMIKRDVKEYVQYNFMSLIDEDYIKSNNIETNPANGINMRILRKYDTISHLKMPSNVAAKDKSSLILVQVSDDGSQFSIAQNLPVNNLAIFKAMRDHSHKYVVENINDKYFRLLTLNKPVQNTLTKCLIMPALYNKVLERDILDKIKDGVHRTILHEYNNAKAKPLNEKSISDIMYNFMIDTLKSFLREGPIGEFSLAKYIGSKDHIIIIEKQLSEFINTYIYDGKIEQYSREVKISYFNNINLVMKDVGKKLQGLLKARSGQEMIREYGAKEVADIDVRDEILSQYGQFMKEWLGQIMSKPSIFQQVFLNYKEYYIFEKNKSL